MGCLEEFLKCNIDPHVRFIVRMFPSFGEIDKPRTDKEAIEDKGETDERVVFDLLEFLEWVGPSNMEALRAKFFNEGVQGGQTEVKPICGPTVIHKRGSLSNALRTIMAAGQFSRSRGYVPCLCLESVITSLERLDTPFAFRVSYVVAEFHFPSKVYFFFKTACYCKFLLCFSVFDKTLFSRVKDIV